MILKRKKNGASPKQLDVDNSKVIDGEYLSQKINCYFRQHTQILAEMVIKLQYLRARFICGAFVCSFWNMDVKDTKLNAKINNKKYQSFVRDHKSQIIGDGIFIWLPLETFSKIWLQDLDLALDMTDRELFITHHKTPNKMKVLCVVYDDCAKNKDYLVYWNNFEIADIQQELIETTLKTLDKNKFMSKRNENDIKSINSMKKRLCKQFNRTQFQSVIVDQLPSLMNAYFENNNLWDEFIYKARLLHKQFGRGSFVCSFARGQHVKPMKLCPLTHIRSCISLFVKHKAQVIADGKFIWLPLEILEGFWPAIPGNSVSVRQSYDMNKSFLFFTIIYVDALHGDMNDVRNQWEFNYHNLQSEIEKYIAFEIGDNNAKDLKVNKFAKKFSDLYKYTFADPEEAIFKCLSLCDYINTFRTFRIDAFHETLGNDVVSETLRKYFPKHLIIEFARNIDIIDPERTHEINQIIKCLNYIDGEEMQQTLINGCTKYIAKNGLNDVAPRFQKINAVNNLYLPSFFMWIIYGGTIELENLKNCRVIGPLLTSFFNSQHYMDHFLQHLPKTEVIESDSNWLLFFKRLIGRLCGNCNKREMRSVDRIEWFKMCPCKMFHYCSRYCQRIHWKQQHRVQCAEYINGIYCVD